MHRWLAPPIPDDLELLLDGEATLRLWTRTLDGGVHAGRICIWLFIRRPTAGLPVDTPVINSSLEPHRLPGGQQNWPRNG